VYVKLLPAKGGPGNANEYHFHFALRAKDLHAWTAGKRLTKVLQKMTTASGKSFTNF
jgi:hypothetical protein